MTRTYTIPAVARGDQTTSSGEREQVHFRSRRSNSIACCAPEELRGIPSLEKDPLAFLAAVPVFERNRANWTQLVSSANAYLQGSGRAR